MIAKEPGALPGILALLSGILTALGVGMVGFTSFTDFNPPGWLRIISMAPLPFMIALAVGFGWAGLKRNSGRSWAIAGLSLAVLSVVAFILMLSFGG